jgi:outer membrane protein OmpA-like peptidoglycan-associated protein
LFSNRTLSETLSFITRIIPLFRKEKIMHIKFNWSFLIVFSILFASFANLGLAQDGNVKKPLRKAFKHQGNYDFDKAEEKYLEALSIDSANLDANYELALFYQEIAYNPDKAFPYFKRSEAVMGNDTVFEVFYHLGNIYQYYSDFDTAIEYYNKVKLGLLDNEEGVYLNQELNRLIAQCEFAKVYKFNAFNGAVRNLGDKINTEDAEYSSLFLPRDSVLLFTARRADEKGKYYFDFQKHESIHYSKLSKGTWTDVSLIDKQPKFGNLRTTGVHDAVVDVSTSTDTIIIFKRDQLWYSVLQDDGKVSKPIKFDKKINISKYQTHGAFSPDGKTFYFASDFKEGYGGLDIYKVEADDEGNWGEAQNMGPTINTEYDEDSPFITADGKRFFFSSKGHLGFGGYDIFYCDLEQGGFWGSPVNVGRPLNSPADDIYYKIGGIKNNLMFFSSNREGGYGNMDLYTYKPFRTPEFQECEDYAVNLDGTKIIAEGPEEAVVGKAINLDASESTIKYAVIIDYFWRVNEEEVFEGPIFSYVNKEEGEFFLELEVIGRDDADNETRYCITRTIPVIPAPDDASLLAKDLKMPKESVKGDVKKSDLKEKEKPKTIQEKKEEEQKIAYAEISKALLESVYFAFDSDELTPRSKETLDKNLKVLEKYGDIEVEIVGHTDAKGSQDYNLDLSKRRVNAVNNYLLANGLKKTRVKEIDYIGKLDPVAPNTTADGQDNPEGRQQNRRVDFFVAGSEAANNRKTIVFDSGNPSAVSHASLQPLPGGLAIELEDIYFNFDKHYLRQDALETCDKNIQILKDNPKVYISIVGHTDWFGSNEYNIGLSKRRVMTTFDYLLANGIDKDRIVTVGYEGEENPAAVQEKPDGSDDPVGRQKNRRVEFRIVGYKE